MAGGAQGQVGLGDDLMHSRDYSDETAHLIDQEVQRILTKQEARCREVLTDHRHALDLVARSLLEHETISGEEVNRLVAAATDTTGATGSATTPNGAPEPMEPTVSDPSVADQN